MQQVSYSAIEAGLKTGDIVLFAGSTDISTPIKWVTLSRWSHVGMVVCLPGRPAPLVWESLNKNVLPDVIDGRSKVGVQTLDLRRRILETKENVAIRQLNQPITPQMFDQLSRLRETLRDRPYEESYWELARAAFDGLLGRNTEDHSSLFCSELVAAAYQVMGLISNVAAGGEASNEYVPGDFSVDDPLSLLLGYELGPEFLVSRPSGSSPAQT